MGSASAPASRNSSGRTTRMKVTNAATGLPGTPTNAPPLITPIATGRPGLMATRQNTSLPMAANPTTGTGPDPCRTDPAPPLRPTILLHEHGIGARRHRRAGENANGFALAYRGRCSASCGDAVDHHKARVPARLEVAMADRVAVDGGIIERRQIEWSDEILCQHAAGGQIEAHALDLRYRAHALAHQPLDVLDREQRAAERETIVGELRHRMV